MRESTLLVTKSSISHLISEVATDIAFTTLHENRKYAREYLTRWKRGTYWYEILRLVMLFIRGSHRIAIWWKLCG